MKLLEFCNVTDQLVRSLLQKTWSAEFCFQLDRAQLQVHGGLPQILPVAVHLDSEQVEVVILSNFYSC